MFKSISLLRSRSEHPFGQYDASARSLGSDLFTISHPFGPQHDYSPSERFKLKPVAIDSVEPIRELLEAASGGFRRSVNL